VILLGGYVKKRLKICELELRNRPKIGATSGVNWRCLAHQKIVIFGLVIARWASFQ